MAKKTIEAEILETYGVKKKGRSESEQDYLRRIAGAVLDAEGADADKKWGSLSEPAQVWANAAGLEHEAEKDISPFPDTKAEEVEAPPPRPSRKAAAEKPEPKATKKAAANGKGNGKAPAKAAKAPKEKAPPKPRKRRGGGSGVYASTQRFVVQNPHASTADIIAALTKKGLTPSPHTVQSVRGHTRDTLRLTQEIHGVKLGFED